MEKLERHLLKMTPSQQEVCRSFLTINAELLKDAAGSTNNHQSWPGGYLGHIEEVLGLASKLYVTLGNRPLSFTLADALFVLFWHDCEKPWRIGGEPGHYYSVFTKDDTPNFQRKKLAEFCADKLLTPEMHNALKYVEGEKGDYTQKGRTMGELAAFCHICDVTSARIFYDYPEH